MDTAVSFGDYMFDTSRQIDFVDNFGVTLPQTIPLFGVDGGLDQYGTDKAPAAIGEITLSFWLYDSMGDLDNQKRTVREMSERGLQRMTMLPNGVTTAATRWCNARVLDCQMPMSAARRSQIRQRVDMRFEVPDPYWNATGANAPIWGQGFIWGDPGAVWGGTGLSITASGLDTQQTITPGGNSMTAPLINATTAAGQTVDDFRIQRLDSSGHVLDECRYSAGLSASQTLLIDCRGRKVTLDGMNAYSSDFTTVSGRWFGLIGGEANIVKVDLGDAGSECTVTFGLTERIR